MITDENVQNLKERVSRRKSKPGIEARRTLQIIDRLYVTETALRIAAGLTQTPYAQLMQVAETNLRQQGKIK